MRQHEQTSSEHSPRTWHSAYGARADVDAHNVARLIVADIRHVIELPHGKRPRRAGLDAQLHDAAVRIEHAQTAIHARDHRITVVLEDVCVGQQYLP